MSIWTAASWWRRDEVLPLLGSIVVIEGVAEATDGEVVVEAVVVEEAVEAARARVSLREGPGDDRISLSVR